MNIYILKDSKLHQFISGIYDIYRRSYSNYLLYNMIYHNVAIAGQDNIKYVRTFAIFSGIFRYFVCDSH